MNVKFNTESQLNIYDFFNTEYTKEEKLKLIKFMDMLVWFLYSK